MNNEFFMVANVNGFAICSITNPILIYATDSRKAIQIYKKKLRGWMHPIVFGKVVEYEDYKFLKLELTDEFVDLLSSSFNVGTSDFNGKYLTMSCTPSLDSHMRYGLIIHFIKVSRGVVRIPESAEIPIGKLTKEGDSYFCTMDKNKSPFNVFMDSFIDMIHLRENKK